MSGLSQRLISSSLRFARCILIFIFVNGLWASSFPIAAQAANIDGRGGNSPLYEIIYTEIDSAAELDAIRSGLSGNYRLMADIDLSSYPNWIPIGTDAQPFTGELDGNGKKITNLKITDTTSTAGQGLFGVVSSPASIHDLTIENAAVTAGDNAGILAGKNGGAILRCNVSGAIGGKTNVGGLVGQNTSTVESSYSTATVTGQASVGGLVGANSGTITTSYAASPVLASVFNNYLQFDGDDYIQIPHQYFYETSSFTLEAWFQWDEALISDSAANNDADVQFIVGKGVENFEIHTEGGSGQRGIRFIPIPRTSIVGETPDAYHDVLDVIRPGWFHVAASYDFNNKEVRVYINGVLQDIYHWNTTNTYRINAGKVATVNLKDPSTNPFASNTEDLLIGARSPSTSPSMFFKGKIADVRFWNIVRTGEEIDADKNKQLTGSEPGLMGYWKLNEGSGDVVTDSSLNVNPGMLMGIDAGENPWVQETISGVGGLVGANTGTVDAASFYDSDVSGMSDTGKGAPLTTTAMQTPTTFTDAGWDSTTTWQITGGAYPSFIRYSLAYAAGSNGTLTGSSPQTVRSGGFGSTMTAVPNTGYHFVTWSDEITTAARTDTGIVGNINVTAQFAINQYTLTYSAGDGGSITGLSPQPVSHGSSGSEVTAVPDEHYHFVQWDDGVMTAARTELNVTGDITATAEFAIDTFTLTYAPGDHGSLSGTTTQTVDYNGSGTAVTVVPATGYHFLQWSDSSKDNPRTDSNVTANLSVTAQYEINQYTLTYSAGTGGSVTGNTPQTVNHGSSGTAVTAVPNTGYHFLQWSDGVTTASRTDSNVTGSLTVTAQFDIDSYTLTYSAGDHGSLTGDATQSVTYGGNGTAVEAVATTGYHFVQWSDGGKANPRTDNNVTTNLSVTAEYEINQYTLTYSAGANGTLTGVTAQTVNHDGSGSTVTAVPDTGYHFVKWSDGVLTEARTDTNVQGDISVTALFAINQYTLTYLAGEGGTVTGTTPQTVTHGGSGSAVTAVPDTGYHFVTWSDGNTNASRTDNPVTDNLSVTAQFEINHYTLTYSAGTGGSLSGTASQGVNYGSDGTAVTAVPDSHYHFVKWSDDVTTATRTDLAVTGNIDVTALFEIDRFTLTYSAGSGGTVTGTTPQTVNYNSSGTTVTAEPNTGYHFTKWSDDVLTASRTDLNVSGNISVTAGFAINQYTLTYTAGEHGSLTGTATQTVDHGNSGSEVTAVPDTGYRFVRWSDDKTNATRTDLDVTGSLTVSALFELDQYALTYTAGVGGSLTGDADQTVADGASGTAVTAVPSAGYYFVRWSDGVTTATRTDSNVTHAITVTAEFTAYYKYYFPIVWGNP